MNANPGSRSAAPCRLLPYSVADGTHNMAADETLLEAAAAGVASLRFYGWSSPTLSLGYFQRASVRATARAIAPLPWVRRPSGGAALVHHHEVTYALALPSGPPWQDSYRPSFSWLCRVHQAVQTALRRLGVETGLCAAESGRPDAVLCFEHLTPADLLVGPSKILGSAQRRQRGALLQHGAVLLAASSHAPSLPGLRELTGTEFAPRVLASEVSAALATSAGWDLLESEWSSRERASIDLLVRDKYTTVRWNEKR